MTGQIVVIGAGIVGAAIARAEGRNPQLLDPEISTAD